MDVRLVSDHAFPRCSAGEVYRIALILRVAGPVVLQNQHEFLRVAYSRDGEQSSPATVENPGDGFQECGFALGARDVRADAEGGLGDQTVDFGVGGDGGGDQMPVVLARVVACEEDVQARDFDQVHACSEDVAGGVGREADPVVGVGGVEGDGVDEGEGGEDVGFVVELVDVAVGAGGGDVGVLHADAVLHEVFVDGFGGVGHVDAAGEVGFAEDVGEGGGVVHVEAAGGVGLAGGTCGDVIREGRR